LEFITLYLVYAKTEVEKGNNIEKV